MSWPGAAGFVPTLIGEGGEGSGSSAARITVVLGDRNGPVGAAWTTALATPTVGHEPFLVMARPGLPVKPWTLLVAAMGVSSADHGALVAGAAQAGVAAGIIEAIGTGVLPAEPAEFGVMIASVWVDPAASLAHQDAVFINNRVAVVAALRSAMMAGPTVAQVLADGGGIRNEHYEPS